MPSKLEIIKLKPSFFQARMKSGMFKMMIRVPMGKPVNLFIIIEIPLIPPVGTEFGSRMNWKLDAYTKLPRNISIKFLISRLGSTLKFFIYQKDPSAVLPCPQVLG